MSKASEVGFTTAITSILLRVGPIGERIHLFQVAEEIRLLNHQCGEVLTRRSGAGPPANVVPVARSKSTNSKADVLVAGDGLRHLSIDTCSRLRGIRMRRELEPRLARTAIRQASASAEAPSYSEAFETSMPVRAHIIDWYS